jgi:hypothetical protein
MSWHNAARWADACPNRSQQVPVLREGGAPPPDSEISCHPTLTISAPSGTAMKAQPARRRSCCRWAKAGGRCVCANALACRGCELSVFSTGFRPTPRKGRASGSDLGGEGQNSSRALCAKITSARCWASTSMAPEAAARRPSAAARPTACRENARTPSCRRAAAG